MQEIIFWSVVVVSGLGGGVGLHYYTQWSNARQQKRVHAIENGMSLKS